MPTFILNGFTTTKVKDGNSEVLFIHLKRKINACLPHPTNILQLTWKNSSQPRTCKTRKRQACSQWTKDGFWELQSPLIIPHLPQLFFFFKQRTTNRKELRAVIRTGEFGFWLPGMTGLCQTKPLQPTALKTTRQPLSQLPSPPLPKEMSILFCSRKVNKSTLIHT